MDNVFSFGASDVLHETLGGTAEGLIGNAIEKVLGKVFEGAGGGIASLFTMAADIALSIYEKEKEAEKRRIGS